MSRQKTFLEFIQIVEKFSLAADPSKPQSPKPQHFQEVEKQMLGSMMTGKINHQLNGMIDQKKVKS